MRKYLISIAVLAIILGLVLVFIKARMGDFNMKVKKSWIKIIRFSKNRGILVEILGISRGDVGFWGKNEVDGVCL